MMYAKLHSCLGRELVTLGILSAALAFGCDDSDDETTTATTTSSSSSGTGGSGGVTGGGGSGGSSDTFTLAGTITVESSITCSDTDTDADCQGDVYWALAEAECQTGPTEYLAFGVITDVGVGDGFTLPDLPVAAQMNVCALLDDNGSSAGAASPADVEADTNDLYGGTALFSAVADDTATQDIVFSVKQQ